MASTELQSATVDDDEFQDAVEEQDVFTLPEHHGEMTLERSLDECRLAVRYFFNNQFDDARELMRPWCDTSMYHAMGYGTMLYLQAIMTFDPRDIETAVEVLRASVEVCNRARRKSTLGETVSKMVKKPDYTLYTEEEAHAELCYAKCLLLRAVLNFVEDETLVSLVKGGLKVKTCYTCYRDCWQMLKHRDWSGSKTKQHFEGGVRLGVGTFNLMISQLPAKILKVLEFVGFTGKKAKEDIGLRELEAGFALTDSIHQSLCSLVLLGYHLVATYFLSNSEGDLVASERILSEQLAVYPNGAFFLFFAGRMELVRGRFERSVQLYRTSWQSQDCWTQFHHVCYWELFWNNVFLSRWEEAAEFAALLLRESRWSRTIYSYLRAASLLMLPQPLPEAQQRELNTLMRTLPDFKQRLAGKSLPAEKFVIAKSRRFLKQDSLLLPGYELLYLWNGFKILKKRRGLVEDVFSQVEEELARQDAAPASSEYAADDRALALLLRGVCLLHLNSPLQAEEALLAVTRLQAELRADHYLVPFAWLELGLLALRAGRTDDAERILEHAKSGYKGYSMINRLHFRVHAAMGSIASLKGGSVAPDPLTAAEDVCSASSDL